MKHDIFGDIIYTLNDHSQYTQHMSEIWKICNEELQSIDYLYMKYKNEDKTADVKIKTNIDWEP